MWTLLLVVVSCLLLPGIGFAQEAESEPSATPPEEEVFGADANPTGDPLGGGEGYSNVLSTGDYHVATVEELLTALGQAKFGQVVYVDDQAELDLTGKRAIFIPPGVTLASGRGRNGSAGALLYTNEDKRTPPGRRERFHLLEAGGIDVRVTGLRLRGPDTGRRGRYEFLNSDGVYSDQFGLEVDNCELWGWSYGAVHLKSGFGAHVHHNYIHHCQRQGLGYGVVLDRAEAIIEATVFDYCRHAIAGTGQSHCGYEARYNLVLEHANGHSFDMHGGQDRRDGTNVAGSWLKIHHNTFQAAGVPAIVVRGRPYLGAEIHHNWFLHKDPKAAVVQKHVQGKLRVYQNAFGPNQIVRK